ncbi:MAG: alpha-L-arabinofuranosidase C-terminal domain-containing protein [Roseburia sp.]
MAERLNISHKKGHKIAEGMIGLFFEDINYAADGGLYAEMIENRSFEAYDCYGKPGDFYAKKDCGYAWKATEENGTGKMEYVVGSPVARENPHYLRFTSGRGGQGFANQAYRGIYLVKGNEYKVSFYARMASYPIGNIHLQIRKNGTVYVQKEIRCVHEPEGSWNNKWQRYEITFCAEADVKGGEFVLYLDQEGTVEFDFISMMPLDAVAGVFRRDLFDAVKDLHPGFIRFPGGCVVEGNTLENRYRWKESVGKPEQRRANYNRWAVHNSNQENGWHSMYSHYNQTLGIGFYEYFLLCEMVGAKPLPVLNVGLACQYQSKEQVEPETAEFMEFVQDALDLIEFANGNADTKWGKMRIEMGHPNPFQLEYIGIGNEQWQTDEVDFFERYRIFERAIHECHPEIKLIGSAGPNVKSDTYDMAWKFYCEEADNNNFCFAVDEHYYMRPEWFLENNAFYDEYPREVKVFSGEYAAHPENNGGNTVEGALSEAAFLTGVERNCDVVVMASYAPLFNRIGFTQWAPDLIWFDEEKVYLTPSYYVQKMFSENLGTETILLDGQEKELREQGLFVSVSWDEKSSEYIIKMVNAGKEEKRLLLAMDGRPLDKKATVVKLRKAEKDNSELSQPMEVSYTSSEEALAGEIILVAESFTVIRFSKAK